MARRRTQAKSLTRKVGSRTERKTVVVFCEGENSEPDYINGLRRLPEVQRNASIDIEIDPQRGVPLTLVQLAANRKRRDGEVDEFWCVFDVEWPTNHPNLKRAVQQAQANGIHVAISNPCFELWLILHHDNQTAFLDTDTACRERRKRDGGCGKKIDAAEYLPRRQDAVQRARSLAARHAANGTEFPKDNPSSTMYELLTAVGATTWPCP